MTGAPSGHSLILAGRVLDKPVFSSQGEHIGHVEDLSIHKVTGQTIYAVMSFGGFLGIGEKFHPLPWSLLDYDPAKGGFNVPLDKAALEKAPYYERQELEDLGGGDPSIGEAIFGYYGRYGALPYL